MKAREAIQYWPVAIFSGNKKRHITERNTRISIPKSKNEFRQ
jgi:hypothetical protein